MNEVTMDAYKREVMRMIEKLDDNSRLWKIFYTLLVKRWDER